MRYKHKNINLLYNEMLEDITYIKNRTILLQTKK